MTKGLWEARGFDEDDHGTFVLLPGIDREANVVSETVEEAAGDADGLFIVGRPKRKAAIWH